jgi:hypothetical protein
MADAVTSQTLFSGSKKVVMAFTNLSDGTGESAVAKVDISGLQGAPTKVKINKVWYNTSGMSVKIAFDHTTDDTVLILQGDGFMDFTSFGGMKDPASAGDTGDIVFTTNGHTAGDTYSIVLEVGLD